MDEATQPSTQPYTDPRRKGQNHSGLLEQDVADIICILHPSSMPAHTAVSTTARYRTQHILQREQLIYEPGGHVSSVSSSDIALRFSSEVKDLALGFCFGRNATRSDILLSPDDGEKKISNMHFRIYLNVEGILMLEDTSTNGTVVDDKLIRKDRRHGSPTTQMLQAGSIIHVMASGTAAGIKFIVRIPSRDEFEAQYRQNFVQYLNRVRQVTREAEGVRHDAPFVAQQNMSSSHGMQWNGGSKYNVTGLIGKGAFATVYKLATKDDGEVYACKELDKRRLMKNNVLDHKVDSEMRIMQGLDHPNIVQFHDYFDHDNRWIYIIMEYVSGGELSSYLGKVGPLEEDMVKTIARQVLHALRHLHRRRITHRDIKPDNILISSFNPLRVKLSDFGLSKVVQEETLLKTFCGTLLYCAPEVYPEYENFKRGEARKRRRVGDPLPKTSPYDQSVDMWSFGAVLFHILCAEPPYTGRGDDRGAQMLRNIMTNDADYSKLTNAGVSEDGVDFIRRLLNRNPADRPKEAECFKHAWLANVADELNYMEVDSPVLHGVDTDLVAVEEADEDGELDASGLEINEASDDDEEYLDEDEQEDGAQRDPPLSPEQPGNVKRQRVHEEAHPDSDHQVVMVSHPPGDVHYPSLPNIESYDTNNPSVCRQSDMSGRRLFGEIPQPALQSSYGALGGQLDAENSADNAGFQEPQSRRDGMFSGLSSAFESTSDFALSLDTAGQTHDNLLSARPSRLALTDPSLMGAESLVGQLHVESLNGHHHRASSTDPNSDNPTTPDHEGETTGHEKDITPAKHGQTKASAAASEEDTPHAEQFNRRIELTPHPSLHSQASYGRSRENMVDENGGSSSKEQRSGRLGEDDEGTKNPVVHDAADELARTIDERTGEEIHASVSPTPQEQQHQRSRAPDAVPNSQEPQNQSEKDRGSPHAAAVHGKGEEEAPTFIKPPPLLGKLTPLSGSISDQPIRLESRMTSWGRGTNATVRHHDPMDSRIPAYALELTFWAPSIESRIAENQDWTQMPDVVTIVSTKTRRRIWVNDVELRSETTAGDAYLFGKVYTGDVITVYRDRERSLRFKCEFYHGKSVKNRAEVGEKKFVVEKTAKARTNGGGGSKHGESMNTSKETTDDNNNTMVPPTVATTMTTTGMDRADESNAASPVDARPNSVT